MEIDKEKIKQRFSEIQEALKEIERLAAKNLAKEFRPLVSVLKYWVKKEF